MWLLLTFNKLGILFHQGCFNLNACVIVIVKQNEFFTMTFLFYERCWKCQFESQTDNLWYVNKELLAFYWISFIEVIGEWRCIIYQINKSRTKAMRKHYGWKWSIFHDNYFKNILTAIKYHYLVLSFFQVYYEEILLQLII